MEIDVGNIISCYVAAPRESSRALFSADLHKRQELHYAELAIRILLISKLSFIIPICIYYNVYNITLCENIRDSNNNNNNAIHIY